MKFYLVDTFSSAAITRQPSCVVIVEPERDIPTGNEMEQFAKELGYSDIVFMQQQDEKSFCSRYFSEGQIVPFKINSTIAAYTVLYKEGLIEDNNVFTEDTGVSLLQINLNDGFITVETESAETLSQQLNYKDEFNLYEAIGVQSETISLKPTADYFKATLPGVIGKLLPEIKTPLMNLKTLMALFQEMTMADEIRKSVAGTPLETVINNEALDPISNFMTEAFKESDNLTKSMSHKKDHHHHQVMAIASPVLPDGNGNLMEHLNVAQNNSHDSFGIIMKRKENDAIQFCGCGTVMAEGQIFL